MVLFRCLILIGQFTYHFIETKGGCSVEVYRSLTMRTVPMVPQINTKQLFYRVSFGLEC